MYAFVLLMMSQNWSEFDLLQNLLPFKANSWETFFISKLATKSEWTKKGRSRRKNEHIMLGLLFYGHFVTFSRCVFIWICNNLLFLLRETYFFGKRKQILQFRSIVHRKRSQRNLNGEKGVFGWMNEEVAQFVLYL